MIISVGAFGAISVVIKIAAGQPTPTMRAIPLYMTIHETHVKTFDVGI
jgi:hypothetical protein